MKRPLAGLRVLDFSRLVPGPYCTALLAGLGAEVIRVEDVANGDLTRHLPPLIDGTGVIFRALHSGKQSVALNLKAAQGQHIARALSRRCDVVVEGFRPGVADRLGIGFTALAHDYPRLIYCSLSGYGQDGPLRALPGHDLTYAAMSGLLDALFPDGPRVPGVQVVDAAAALLAAVRILAALYAVEDGPQYLDVSLNDAARALMPLEVATAGLPSGPSVLARLRGGERNDVYRCADGRYLALTPLEEPFWRALVAALRAMGEWADAREPASADLHRIFARRSCEEWYERLAAASVPCAPVRSVAEAEDGKSGAVDAPVPKHGQHTHDWLLALGYSDEEIRELDAMGVIRVNT